MDEITNLDTADAVIDACGGTHAVATHFGLDDRVVSNWRSRGLPPETFAAFQDFLASKGRDAPRSLWRQRQPSATAS